MRRVGVTSLLALVALLGIPTAGSAAIGPYPPNGPTAGVDPGATTCGSTFTVSGTKWHGSTGVTITLDSQRLGTVTTDGAGSFSTTFQVPIPTSVGDHSITETGLNQDGNPVSVSTTLDITSCLTVGGIQVTRPGQVGTSGSTTTLQGLAFTGSSNTSLYAGVGILLVLVGFVLTIAVRRRRVHWHV